MWVHVTEENRLGNFSSSAGGQYQYHAVNNKQTTSSSSSTLVWFSFFRISSTAKRFTFKMHFLEQARTPYNLSLYGRGQEVGEVCQKKIGKIRPQLHWIALYCGGRYARKVWAQLHCQLHAAPLNPRKMRLTLDRHPANIHRSIAHLMLKCKKNHRITQIHKHAITQIHKHTISQIHKHFGLASC